MMADAAPDAKNDTSEVFIPHVVAPDSKTDVAPDAKIDTSNVSPKADTSKAFLPAEAWIRPCTPDGFHSDEAGSKNSRCPNDWSSNVVVGSDDRKLKRAIFIDWMRAVSIYLVVLAHILVTIAWTVDFSEYKRSIEYDSLRVDPYIFAAYCEYGFDFPECRTSLKESKYSYNLASAKIFSCFRVCLQFGIPCFMYFSGRSLAFNRDGFCMFMYKKALRLLVPLVFGYFLLVVPTTYISCEWRPGLNTIRPDLEIRMKKKIDIDGLYHCHDGFFRFASWMISNFKEGFSWLWFLPALFSLSVINYPISVWYKTRYWGSFRGIVSEHDKLYLPWIAMQGGIAVFSLHYALGVTLWYGCLVASPYALNSVLLYAIDKIREIGRFELMLGVAQVVPSLFLAMIHNDELEEHTIKRGIAAVCFYNFFYLQGFVDQVLDTEYQMFKETPGHKIFRPLGLFLLVVAVIVTSPGSEYNVGNLWVYPMYRTWPETTAYVGGSWIWKNIFVGWGQTFYDEYFQNSKSLYTHVTASSLIIYLIHWPMADLLTFAITRPGDYSLVPALLVLVLGTFALSWMVSRVLLSMWTHIFSSSKAASRVEADLPELRQVATQVAIHP